jgi:Tol biopolymer transport system component
MPKERQRNGRSVGWRRDRGVPLTGPAVSKELMMSYRPRIAGAFTLALALLVTSCSDTESPLSPSPDDSLEGPTPSLSISDGAHAGNEHFYFLPPLVKRPSTSGVFDPTQSPVVEICELVREICLSTVATYTMDSGPESDRIRLDAKKETYSVGWDTGAQRLPAGGMYRIYVRVESTELGHADVLLTAKKGKTTADRATAIAGSTVDIRFRIEAGVVPPGGDIVLHDNVVPVDSTVLTLVSTDPELAAGTYRFDVIGSPVPDIAAGDVLAGPEGLGFMRIVTSVKVTGKRVVAETTQADLSDIIKEGGFSVSVPLDVSSLPPPSGSAVAPLYYMAPGVSTSGRLIEFENLNLCEFGGCPEWLSLTVPSGYVDFAPVFEWKVDFGLTSIVDTFGVVVGGNLVYDIDALAVASKEFSAEGDTTLVALPVPIPLPYGLGRLIKAQAVLKLKAGYQANASVKASVQSGIHLETGVRVGGEYTYGNGWAAVWDTTFNASAKETRWVAQGDGTVRVYVRPEVQLVVSTVEGPYAGIEPYLKAYGHVGTEECQVRLTRGTDGDVVLTAKVAGKQLPKVTKAWPGEEKEILKEPCPIGHLKVQTTTNGTSPDPDGYTVTLDGIDPKPAGINGTVVYSPLFPTTYTVELAGLAENCSVTSNPRSITVAEGDTVLVAFPVTCGEPETGILQVKTTTTGEDDGYTVTTDGASPSSKPIGVEGQVSFDPVVAGDRTVELTGLGPNCVVAGDNPRVVNVAPDATASTDFDVTCGLTVNVTTTGSDPDPDGYTVLLDSAPHALADVNGDLWFDIPAGPYTVELTDVASQCAVSGDNPRIVNAPGQETLSVECGSPPGVVTYARDFNVWQIRSDGSDEQQLTTDGVSGAWYRNPRWSPDGTRVAFERQINCGSYDGDCTAIFTAFADGSGLTQVSFPEVLGHDSWPDWSPNGARIVYARNTPSSNGPHLLIIVDADGTNATEVLSLGPDSTQAGNPSWTHQNTILFGEQYYDYATVCSGWVSTIAPDGSGRQRLSSDLGCENVGLPELSPDGTRIAFLHNGPDTPVVDIFAIDPDGSNMRNLTSGAITAIRSFAWSLDGSQIAYSAGEGQGVGVMDADGSSPTLLTSGWLHGVDWRPAP